MEDPPHESSNGPGRMHQALLIREILDDVCQHATNETLFSLAQSCKVLHDTAIQVLWSQLYNMYPLIKTLPEDSWIIDGEHIVSERFTDLSHSLLLIRILNTGNCPFPRT